MSAALLVAAGDSTGLPGWAADLLDTLGAPGIGVLTALEQLCPLSPSEPALVLGGVSTGHGRMSPIALVVWSTIGSLVGSLIMYYLGRRLGRDRCRALLVRIPLTKGSDFDRSEAWFAARGARAVLVGRLIPGLRTFISFPAGVQRMPLTLYIACTLLGSLVWNANLIGLGYLVGHNWSTIGPYVAVVAIVVAVAFWSLIIRFVVVRLGERRRARTGTIG